MKSGVRLKIQTFEYCRVNFSNEDSKTISYLSLDANCAKYNFEIISKERPSISSKNNK